MDYEKSLEEIEKALSYLKEENKEIPIIVEGEKDINALKQLNIVGEIIKGSVSGSHILQAFTYMIVMVIGCVIFSIFKPLTANPLLLSNDMVTLGKMRF